MTLSLLLTIAGKDRPGLVQRVAGVVADHDGNWLESRLVHLGGQFAGVVRVEIPALRREALEAALAELGNDGPTVTCTELGTEPLPAPRPIWLEITGHDRPGIVSEISGILARHRLNVEELTSEVTSAPMTGDPLFHARLRLTAPPKVDLRALRKDLERTAGELMVDVSLDN
jgi:glycine cleavage system regulatory protein